MIYFDEIDDKGRDIRKFIEMFLVVLMLNYEVTLKEPAHDVARRFLNEIVEFKTIEEGWR